MLTYPYFHFPRLAPPFSNTALAIGDVTDEPLFIRSGDLNEDKLLDLIVVLPRSVIWFQQLGTRFSSPRVLFQLEGVIDMALGDIDGDGMVDAAVILSGGTLQWHRSKGKGVMGGANVLGTSQELEIVTLANVFGPKGTLDLVGICVASWHHGCALSCRVSFFIDITAIRESSHLASFHPD